MREYPLITPKFEREWDNAPGPFYVVKDQCILCALPPETAPHLDVGAAMAVRTIKLATLRGLSLDHRTRGLMVTVNRGW